MPQPRAAIITQEELLRNPKEREARRNRQKRLRQCAIRQAKDVADLFNGRHHERVKETMKRISEAAEAAGQQP